ncbi:MAG TPA: hypothetical protein VE993_13235 [Stellaceae bacterium]|nr:hypothetical protein [Stellaceae bacterium]
MPMTEAVRRLRRSGALILILALFGCAGPPRAGLAESAAPPPGYARIWIYRTYNPYTSQATPYVRINGRIVGVSELGGALYRDVPPGVYTITVDSPGRDVNQFATVALVAGQVVYIKTDANNWWATMCRRCEVDTFYTRVVSPQLAHAEMAALPAYAGG